MTENEIQHVEVSPVEPNSLSIMEKAEIDIQIATARAYPRSLAAFQKKAVDMVSLDSDTAQSCIYRRPVGKEGGKVIYAEGESIREAEIVAACYGHLRYGAMITEMNPRYVKAMGFCHDLENNCAVKAEVVEATVTKDGYPFSERMRVVVAKAAQSKALRDAIFRIVPKSLCKQITNAAKEIILGKGETLEQRRARMTDWLGKLPLDKKRVFTALGVKGIEEIGNEHLITLTGIRTALKDNEITLDEAFPEIIDVLPKGVSGIKEKLGIANTANGNKKERVKTIKEQAKKLVEETLPPPKECRYVCLKCDHEFDVLEDGTTCPNCASNEYLDRELKNER